MMERLLRDIYDAISSLRQRISYLETQDGVADLSDAMSFVQLTDAPDNYIGQAGKVVAVTAGEDGLEFVAGGGALADHDHSGDPGDGGTFDAANLTSGTAADGYVLTADGLGGAAWEAVSGGASELNDLTDVDLTTPPSDGQALVFDSGSGTWKAETLAGGVTDFLDLSDTPVAYPATRQLLSPNDSGDGLEFVEKTVISEGFLEIASDPAKFGTKVNLESYTSSTTEATRLSLLRGRGTQASPSNLQDEDRLGNIDFRNAYTNGIAATISSSVDGTPTGSVTPGSLSMSLYNPDGTFLTPFTIRSSGLVGINESNPEGQLHVGGEVALEDITTPDTPPAGIHKIYSKSDGIYVLDSSGSEIGPINGGASELNDLTDVDLTTPPSDGQALVYDAGDSKWIAGGVPGSDANAIHINVSGEIASLTEKVLPVSGDLLIIEDSADSNAKKKVQVGNLPGGGAENFIDLDDTPANYNGSAGFFVTPNQAEDGLEFTRLIAPSYSANGSLIIRQATGNYDVRFLALNSNLRLQTASLTLDAGLEFWRQRGSLASPSAVQDGDVLGSLRFRGRTSSSDVLAGHIGFAVKGTPTSTNIPTKFFIILERESGDIEAFTILPDGNVGIGETAPEDKLHVSGAIALNDISTPSTPSSDTHKIYAKSDGIYVINSAGTEIGPLGTGGKDENAIHDDESGEIAALTEKTTPVSADLLIIEDSDASYAKKKVQVGNLPGAQVSVGARVFHSVAQTIPNNTEVVLAFNSERYDTSNLHSTVSNTSRLTAPVAGKYLITAAISWDSHATGYRTVYLRLNGSTWIAIQRDAVSGAAVWPQTITTVYDLGENDYVEVSVRHTAGVALDILAANNYSPEFAMQWLGP